MLIYTREQLITSFCYYHNCYQTYHPEEIISKIDIDAALDTLTKRQKEVIQLFLDGYTSNQVAEIMNLSHQNVHVRKDKAIDNMLKYLNS